MWSVYPDSSVYEALQLMGEKDVGALLYEGKNLIGLISIGDVVKVIISGQKIEIKQLEHYISGILHGH